MKKVLVGFFILIVSVANAQQEDKTLGQEIKQDAKATGNFLKKGAKATGHAVKKGAKAVGKKTSEVASKGHSEVVDKTYDGKMGPNGEKVFINDKSEYYWVDKKGHRHYVKESELKEKED